MHYETITTLLTGPGWELSRARRSADGAPVLIRSLTGAAPSPGERSRLQRDFAVASALAVEGVARPLSFVRSADRLLLVLEDCGGLPLELLIPAAGFPLPELLAYAAAIANALDSIHRRDIVHKNLSPSCILLDPASGAVRITDFGIAAEIPAGRVEIARSLEGSAAYVSPELTGRLERPVDSRADLYALGVIFYRMATGVLPFNVAEEGELLHCHLARMPEPPSRVRTEIPRVVSEIIMKLLEKMPDARYQGACGLAADLRLCAAALREKGSVVGVEIGVNDVSDRFLIPLRLYGRDEEERELLAACARAASGEVGLVLVAGPAGIGKTTLIEPVQRHVAGKGGFFARGKFDQYERAIPFSAIIQALACLIAAVLAGSEESLASYRRAMEPLRGEGDLAILAGVIPDLALVTGPLPAAAAAAGPAETEARLMAAFRRFIGIFAGAGHPVIIFLDDLQWADIPSLKLVRLLIEDPGCGHLLVIGAYRDNEVTPSHPLRVMLDRVVGLAATRLLRPGPLPRGEIDRLLTDTLHPNPSLVAPLGLLLEGKTGGNPFFIKQLLTALHADGLFRFNRDTRAWEWDVEAVRGSPLGDDLLSLLATRIAALSPRAQELLGVAACIGSSFDPALVARVLEAAVETLRAPLDEAINAGLAYDAGNGCRFIHDRVRQAAYDRADDGARERHHLAIGRALLEPSAGGNREERLFDIVGHLNRCAGLVTGLERDLLARLNAEAAKRAKASAAYRQAAEYLSLADRLHPDNARTLDYTGWFQRRSEQAQCLYLAGEGEAADAIVDETVPLAASDIDRAQLHGLRVSALTAASRYGEAVETGLRALRLVGVRFPAEPGAIVLLAQLARVKLMLRLRGIKRLADAPPALDPAVRVLFGFFTDLGVSLYNSGRHRLLAYGILRMMRLTIAHGTTGGTPYIFCGYGFLLAGVLGDYDGAHAFGTLAMEMARRLDDRPTLCRTALAMGHGIIHWKEHARAAADLLEEAYGYGVRAGDLLNTGNALITLPVATLYAGVPLPKVQEQVERSIDFSTRVKDYLLLRNARLLRYFIGALRGDAGSGDAAGSDLFREDQLPDQGRNYTLSSQHILDEQRHYLFGRYGEAMACARRAAAGLGDVMGMNFVRQHYFYAGLIAARLCDNARFFRLPLLRARIAASVRRMRRWAACSPENCAHKLFLLRAEQARVRGKDSLAAGLYERSVESALENGFIQNAAVANECAAHFYRSTGRGKIANLYLAEAYSLYQAWGAAAKARDLAAGHPEAGLAAAVAGADAPSPAPEPSPEAPSTRGPDLETVRKASLAMSGDAGGFGRVRELLKLILENGGAGRIVLLCYAGDGLAAWAALDTSGEPSFVFDRTGGSAPVPESIVRFVRRTGRTVSLGNAAAEWIAADDPSFRARRPGSLLCVPVPGGSLPALLYLENNLATDALGGAEAKLDTLRIVASQALLLMENILHREGSFPGAGKGTKGDLARLLVERYGLTRQEALIATCMKRGMDRAAICEKLAISYRTLRNHLQSIYDKTLNTGEFEEKKGRSDKASQLIGFLYKLEE